MFAGTMPLSKDEIIETLRAAGVEFELHEHQPAMTVEAQVAALPGNPTTVLKNLFLKDKKHRCYIITALADTPVDLQNMSARLGTGKGGVRLAPEDLLLSVLQVPLGSVTPFAIANPGAKNVVLILDHNIKDQACVYAHPLVNTASLQLTPAALDAALRCCGREPLYVDLQAKPKVDASTPPDLKALADAAEPPPAALPPADGAASDVAAALPATAAPAPAAPAKGADKKAPAKGAGSSKGAAAAAGAPAGSSPAAAALTDVLPRVEAILAAACSTLAAGATVSEACEAGKVDPYALARLRADLEMQLTSLKNASFAAGYVAGKGEMVARADRRYA